MKIQVDVTAMRERLNELKVALYDRMENQKKKIDLIGNANLDRSDTASAYAYCMHHISLLEQFETRFDQVNEALERIEEGMYGVCANCGKPIMAERLEALPYAEFCIDCQRLKSTV